MKIKIIRTTVADKRTVRAGSVEDVSENDAKTLILLGKAIALPDDEPVEAPVEELNSDNAADVIAESRPRRTRKFKG